MIRTVIWLRIRIWTGTWNDWLDFWYDADLRRVKKEFRTGQVCECGVESPGIPKGKDEATESDSLVVKPIPKGSKTALGDHGGDCVCYSTTTTIYVYTYDGKLVREIVNGEVKRDYLYAGSERIGVSERIGSSNNFRLMCFIKDHLGSTRQLVDSTGNVMSRYDYYPYGGLRNSYVNVNTKLRYTGKQLDDEEVGQYYYGARYLHMGTLRFNSLEPLQDKYPTWRQKRCATSFAASSTASLISLTRSPGEPNSKPTIPSNVISKKSTCASSPCVPSTTS